MKFARIALAAILTVAMLSAPNLFGDRTAFVRPAAAQALSVRVYFSPEDQPSRILIAVFDHAQRQILFAIYDLTNRPIADALIGAARRHIDVWGIMDLSESRSRRNLYPELEAALGNHLALRSGSGRYGIMHDKYAIVDGSIVATGSYNWSYSADRSNRENLLIITNPELAQQFAQNFRTIWQSP